MRVGQRGAQPSQEARARAAAALGGCVAGGGGVAVLPNLVLAGGRGGGLEISRATAAGEDGPGDGLGAFLALVLVLEGQDGPLDARVGIARAAAARVELAGGRGRVADGGVDGRGHARGRRHCLWCLEEVARASVCLG